MSNDLALGIAPTPLTVHLTTGADFVCQLTHKPGSWPSGTSVALVFADGTTWPATVAAATATFDVDKATADLPADGTRVRLVVTNGGSDETWSVGEVRRHA